ncbi:hypothetical protein SAMN06298211_102187 [Prevotellaceae bacterium MN60]|jgi:hypothetical protein|nr:hypothetical protein SAMN06298211_102187 [Prevotellaceae bacterium MN60]
MKKLILLALLAIATTAQGQEAYNELRQKAKTTISNPNANAVVKQISQFKLDALNYMAMKMREVMPDSSATFLDKQAIAMDNFVNFYIEKLIESTKQPNVEQVKMIKMFMDASYSNPLFEDKDTELVLSYYNSADSMTRFSLDTDWRKAVAAIAYLYNKKE